MASKIINDKILIREIVLILLIKVILLFFIWHSFFDNSTSPVTANTIADQFISDDTQGDPL